MKRRLLRRKQYFKRRNKWKKLLTNSYDYEPSSSELGLFTNTAKNCQHIMCGNPRRYFGRKTRQELIFDETYNNSDS